MSHYAVIEMPFAPRTKLLQNEVMAMARFAIAPADRLVIFVHGFHGAGTKTWPRFESLLPQDPRAAQTDILFFQYDGLFNTADVSATYLRILLDQLVGAPARLINRSLDMDVRPDEFRYQRIVLASHSTGAIVVRRAVLDALHSSRSASYQAASVRMVFYAPAHCGARVAQLVSMAATGYGWLLPVAGKLAQFKCPLLVELDPGTSKTLPRLLEDTRRFLARGVTPSLLVAHSVIQAQNDNVVFTEPFCEDTVDFELLAGEDHTTVCKPRFANESKYLRLADALFA